MDHPTKPDDAQEEQSSLLRTILAASGILSGYWLGQHIGRAFQHRFAPDDAHGQSVDPGVE
jgi:hypothetical protein